MPTLNKLEYLDETKQEIKTALNTNFNSGITDEDTFRSYVTKIDNIYTNWPKVTGEGTEITLSNTKKGRMPLEPKGNTIQDGIPTPDVPVDIRVVKGDNTIKVTGKNLFNKNNIVDGYVNNGGGITSLSGYKTTGDYIEIKPNTQYYKNISGSTRWKYFDENKNVYSNNNFDLDNATREQIFTTPANVKYLKFTLSDDNVDNFILAESSTATTYEPYQEQTYPLDLGDIELCKIGDYQDYFTRDNKGIWGITKAIGKVVLDGSEAVVMDTKPAANTYNSFNIYPAIAQPSSVCYCDKLLYSESSIYSNDIQGIKPTSSGLIKVKIFDSTLTTIETFKTWLSNNNLLVYYVLATPTGEEIGLPSTSTLASQLEALYNAISVDGTNIITSTYEEGNAPVIINATALMKGGN